MELVQRVRRELKLEEKCVQCTTGHLLKDETKHGVLLALVTRLGDNALFVFQWWQDDCLVDSSLVLMYALAIRGSFAFTADTTVQTGSQNGDVFRFQIRSDEQRQFVFEVKSSGNGKDFLLELSKAIGVYRQKAHLIGIPEFKWLEHYKDQIARTLSYSSPDGWWDNLMDSTSNSPVTDNITASRKDDSLDVFGMPEFSSRSSIVHPTLDRSGDQDSEDSPLMRRRHVMPKGARARQGFIKLHMVAREDEYTDIQKFKFFVGTWNVNGQNATESVIPWLAADQTPPDIVAVGFQELDLSTEAYLGSSPREEVWSKVVEQGLHPRAKYTKVKSVRLVGIFLLVFVQSRHMPYVEDVFAQSVATGIMGLVGNKGGVAIRMVLHNTSLCFVNSHLAAHTEEYERRNQDYRDITGKLEFSVHGEPLCIVDHDIFFWLGDLNYRVSDIDTERVRKLASSGQYDELLKNDQLVTQMAQKNCFIGYREGAITFKPTYKYDPGTDVWDTSEKGRAPAWCDRVLWHGSFVNQLEYRSHPALKLSDHKPVSSLFEIGIKVVDREKERRTMEDVIRTLDRCENENLPHVTLSTTEVIFKNVQFMEKQSHVFNIKNTGVVAAQFQFIAKLDDADYCKPWLTVRPEMGIIMPGHTKNVKFTVCVNKNTAGSMNSGDDKLEDILVLHLEGGKDLFITISGNYLPSVFGSSLEALVNMYGPIREVAVAKLVDLEHSQSSSMLRKSPGNEPLEIPKELWLIVDHLFNFGLQVADLLRQSGFEADLEQIRGHLDSGSQGKLPGSIHSVAEALLIFLEALPESVIPHAFSGRALECCNNYLLSKQVIFQLPKCHQNVFTYLTAFLRELLRNSSENKLDVKTLATLFGPLFIRPTKARETMLSKKAANQLTQKKARFVSHFLINEFGAD